MQDNLPLPRRAMAARVSTVAGGTRQALTETPPFAKISLAADERGVELTCAVSSRRRFSAPVDEVFGVSSPIGFNWPARRF